MRRSVQLVVSFVLALAVFGLPFPAQGQAPATAVQAAPIEAAPALCTAADLQFLKSSRPISPQKCTAETTCSNGVVLQCSGTTGQTCTDNIEPCVTSSGCLGTRAYVECGSTKKTCVCSSSDPGCGCPNPSCPQGAFCTSNADCEPCGTCFHNSCGCRL